jgi:hypothetical protein
MGNGLWVMGYGLWVMGYIFAGFAANRNVRHTLLLVALMIGSSTALSPTSPPG